MAESDKIPREVLRWLQSLDLAYSIKNPRRDFANGFLVAEIFYRYYVKAIQIHSYDNGISLAAREGNWGLLRKFFRQRGIPITDDDIDAVMYSRPGQVVGVIKKMYTFLTQRKLVESQASKETSNLPAPPFMKPTAAQAIRETLGRGGDQIDDLAKKAATVRDALDSHKEMLSDTRSIDANRQTTVSKVLTGETRTIAKEPERPQVVVRKVQVKSIDRNIAQLRAKQAAAAGGSMPKKTVLQGGGSPNHGHSGSGSFGSSNNAAEALFNEGVAFALGPENAGLIAGREGDAARAFMEKVDSAQPVPDPLAVRIVRDAFGSQVAAAAEAATADPREFHKAFHLLSIPLRLRAGPVFAAAADVLAAFGGACAALDAVTTRSLFMDLALGVVVRVAGNLAPPETRRLVEVCAAFVGPAPRDRLELLKLCRDTLYARNDAVLVGMLSAAAGLEDTAAGGPSGELLDLYTLYCRGGLTAGQQGGGAVLLASLRLLGHIARWASNTADGGGKAVVEMVPAVAAVLASAEAAPPAVQEAALQAAALLLPALQPGEGGEELEEKIWQLVATAGSEQERVQRLAAVVPHSVERGVEELFKLSPEALEALLNDAPSPSSASSLHETWNPAEVAGAVADLVVAHRQENLEAPQMAMLASVATQAAALGRVAGDDMEARWSDVLAKLGKYVFVALTDTVLVESAVEFLSVFLLGPGSGRLRLEVLERKHLVSSMMLLFRDGDTACQAKVCRMLGAALDTPGHPAAADVAAFVNSIEQYISDPTDDVQRLLDRAQQFDEEANGEP